MEQNNPSVFPLDKRDSVDRSNPEAVCGQTKIGEARARLRRCSSGIQEAQRWGLGARGSAGASPFRSGLPGTTEHQLGEDAEIPLH
jgi:hypothetical protein